jgi:hypothetical protein
MTDLIGKSWVIKKAWVNADGSVNVEGWVSTNIKDIEKDIMEPETFAGPTIKGYFDRGAPISTEHNTRDYPVGYMLKSALIREGDVFEQLDNTRYPKMDFRYFDEEATSITGWYGLGVIDDERAALAVAKGKLSSFSWIGMPRLWTPIPGGGRHFSQKGGIDPLLEATITAYPINPTAIMRVAKAYGYARPRLSLDPDRVERVLRSI